MNHLSIEDFLINDKVTTVVNLLSKYRIKLWELKDLSLEESEKEIEVSCLTFITFGLIFNLHESF